jgi:hypothetical protein
MKTLGKFLSIIIVLAITSCKTDPFAKAKAAMGKWYEQKVSFPEQVEYLNEDLVSKRHAINYGKLSDKKIFYVVHYFDAGCDKCISDLKNAQVKIKTLYEDKAVKFIFIADAPNNYFAKKAIDSIHFEYPVYYEKQPNKLHLSNHFPIGDSLYNTFLINNQSQLILFASVFDNQKAQKLLEELITK